jgi:hypothetical protein
MMPLAPPLAEMLWKVRLPEPMLVIVTSRAVPVVDEMLLVPVAVMAPPWVKFRPLPLAVWTAMLDIATEPTLLPSSLMPSPLPAVVSMLMWLMV